MERWRLSCILHSCGKSHSKTKELFLPMENNNYQKRVAWSTLQSEWEKVVHLGQCPVSHFEGYLVNIQKVQCKNRDKSGTQSSTTSQKEAWDRRKVVWMWAMSQMSCRSVFGLVCRLASDASDLVKASSLCRLRVGHIDPGQFGLSTSSHGYIFLNLVCTFHSWPGLWG